VFHPFERDGSRGRGIDDVPGLFQVKGNKARDIRVVFDHQHAAHGGYIKRGTVEALSGHSFFHPAATSANQARIRRSAAASVLML
jgi:hypothetical protein